MPHHAARRAMIAAVILALSFPAARAGAAPPNPIVTGPIPETATPGDPSHDYIFFSSPQVDAGGYVEEEFFLEGTANVYDTPPLTTGTIVSSGHPYRTRIVVRRPADPRKFNGTVILEWQNVTGGFDLDSWPIGIGDHLMRQGYAWVGVSAQRAGIHAPGSGLKAWSPSRYGTLDVTDGGTVLDDGLCYDIFSQAGQAVMHPVGVDPLAGLARQRILATGGSQSAFRLGIYYNSIQPLANLVQGFLLALANPWARNDLAVPMFKLHTETDAANVASGIGPSGAPIPPLQPDDGHVRTWQVAGASHLDGTDLDNIRQLGQRDGLLLPPPGLCANPEGSRVPFYEVDDKGFDHLARWIKDGTPPPTAPLIETTDGVLVRDERGLARGGIRLAAVAVPTALNTGINSGPFFCALSGTHIPFDSETLAALYPDHGTYVDAVQAVVDANLTAGYISTRDAQTTITSAAMSGIGFTNLGGARERAGSLPVATVRLAQNRPNPLGSGTEIRYSLGKPGSVRLSVYTVTGQRVCRLVDRFEGPGEHSVIWLGTDDRHRPLPNGVYFYRLTTPEFDGSRKLVIDR